MTTSNPIPIALCITDLEVGGAERMFLELALGLAPTQFSPHVFVLGSRPPAGRDHFASQLDKSGIPVEFLCAKHVWHFPAIVRRLRSYFRTLQPEIVQTFLWHANIAGSLAARRAGVPHVLTGIRVAERRVRGHLWLARRLADSADYHVCVSRSVAEFSTAVGRLPPERLVVIPNGVRTDRFPAEPADLSQFGIAPSRQTVIAIGRLEVQKRFDQLLGIAPQLFAKRPDCEILIVGEGPERSRLEAMRRALGKDRNRIHLVGRREDAANLLAAADLLVLTSRWEGMPNVVLEAMASGKPVVAADVEGVRELLGIDAGSSLQEVRQIYSPAVPHQLAEKAVAILSDGQLALELSVQNRRRVEQRYRLDSMVSNYLNLYREVLAGATPSAVLQQP